MSTFPIYYIYALSDPRHPRVIENIRYVGKTQQRLSFRLANHLRERHNGYRTNWIQSLSNIGLKPEIWPLCACNSENWQDLERAWIARLRPLARLTNLTDGGDGICGYKHTEEYKKQLSIYRKGKSFCTEETRKKLSLAGLGRVNPPITEETRTKMRLAKLGRKLTDAHKKKLSEANKGRVHTWGHKISATFKARGYRPIMTPEGRKRNLQKQKLRKMGEFQRQILIECNSKPVKCIETGQIFESAKKANQFFKNKGPIGRAIKKNLTFSGYHWEYVPKQIGI